MSDLEKKIYDNDLKILFRIYIAIRRKMGYSDKEEQKKYFKEWYENNKEYASELHKDYYYAVGRIKKQKSYALKSEFKRLCQIDII